MIESCQSTRNNYAYIQPRYITNPNDHPWPKLQKSFKREWPRTSFKRAETYLIPSFSGGYFLNESTLSCAGVKYLIILTKNLPLKRFLVWFNFFANIFLNTKLKIFYNPTLLRYNEYNQTLVTLLTTPLKYFYNSISLLLYLT